MSCIGVIDCGGNFGSVWNALTFLGLDCRALRASADFDAVDRVILPGVGAFPALMRKLSSAGLVEALQRHVVERGKPYLGICLGMQVLGEEGREFERCRGLGWIGGIVDRITATGLRVPHIGWNRVEVDASCPLFAGMSPRLDFYFVHSYELRPVDASHVVGRTDYGGPVTSCVQKGHIFGVQFHPEKSQGDGLRLLKNFSEVR